MGATNWKNISSHYQARWYWPLSHKLSNPKTQFVYTPQQNRMAAVKVWFPPFSMNTFSKANGLKLLTTPEKPTQTTTNFPLPTFDRSALILKRGGKTRTQLWWNLETPGQHAIERQSWKNAMVEVNTIFSKTQFQNHFCNHLFFSFGICNQNIVSHSWTFSTSISHTPPAMEMRKQWQTRNKLDHREK